MSSNSAIHQAALFFALGFEVGREFPEGVEIETEYVQQQPGDPDLRDEG
jgi:hypothetical protein